MVPWLREEMLLKGQLVLLNKEMWAPFQQNMILNNHDYVIMYLLIKQRFKIVQIPKDKVVNFQFTW